VVIPTLNGEESIERAIAAVLAQQAETSFEVIVVDNRSTDGTPGILAEIAAREPLVRIVDAARAAGTNVARNEGARAARGEWILFTDDDDEVQPGWIAAYAEAFDGGAECVGGPFRQVTHDGRVVNTHTGLYGGRFLPFPLGANCGMRRDVLDRVGGFDESFSGGGDEVEWFWRAQLAGFRLVLVEDAWLDHTLRRDDRSDFRQAVGYAEAGVKLFRKFRKHGMRRRWGGRLARELARVLVRPMLRRSTPDTRRRRARVLGRAVGKLRASIRYRTFYF